MATRTLNKTLSQIDNEVELLRSALIGFIGEDEEGAYHPEFIRELLKASQEKPKHEFKDIRTFLAHIRRSRR